MDFDAKRTMDGWTAETTYAWTKTGYVLIGEWRHGAEEISPYSDLWVKLEFIEKNRDTHAFPRPEKIRHDQNQFSITINVMQFGRIFKKRKRFENFY